MSYKYESDFALKFRHWIRANPQFSGMYELKDSRGKKSILFSEIKEEQIHYALAGKGSKGVLIRVQALGGGEPDYVYFRNAPAWIVINYPGSFHIIDIDTFMLEKGRNRCKSLTEERAKAISFKSVVHR